MLRALRNRADRVRPSPWPLTLVGLVVLASFASAQQTSTPEESPSRPDTTPGSTSSKVPVPRFTLTDSAGHPHDLARVTSPIIVLEWTAPGCAAAERAYDSRVPQELTRRYATRGVSWFAVHSPGLANTETTPTTEEIDRWRRDLRLACPVLLDPTGEIARRYDVRRVPTYVVLHRGQIVYRGALDNSHDEDAPKRIDYVARAIDELLAGHRVTISRTEPVVPEPMPTPRATPQGTPQYVNEKRP